MRMQPVEFLGYDQITQDWMIKPNVNSLTYMLARVRVSSFRDPHKAQIITGTLDKRT